MITKQDENLHIYILNVGQGDTTIIISPQGQIVIIDAKNPGKIIDLLEQFAWDKTIEHLIITHPHADHFSGANRLADHTKFKIVEATFAPFWHEFGMGPPTYRKLIGKLVKHQDTNINFISGYSRWYPDQIFEQPPGQTPELDRDAPYLELLGPTNGLVSLLEEANVFKTNHLSIMSRLTWKDFRMIITGDAQMENWGPFDNEKLLKRRCIIFRASHHGSSNGTQYERLDRLNPSIIIVSSDPSHGHHLPDLASAAVFAKYDVKPDRFAVITRDSGTIHIEIDQNSNRTLSSFNDPTSAMVNLTNRTNLDEISNPTDWAELVKDRVSQL